MTVLLDDLDRRLITLLMEDASRTNVFLARELGVSDGTVRNRIQNLIDKGVMEIVAVVDPWKVGHKLQIICGIEVDLDRAHVVARTLADYEEVTYVAYTTGEYDLIIVAVLRSEEELFYFLTDKLGRTEGVRRIRTNQVLKTLKRTFRYDRVLRREEEDEATLQATQLKENGHDR